jgi:hypothetical protein
MRRWNRGQITVSPNISDNCDLTPDYYPRLLKNCRKYKMIYKWITRPGIVFVQLLVAIRTRRLMI